MFRKPAPVILTASMRPQDVFLEPERPAWVRCPWCQAWFKLKRRMLPDHTDVMKFDDDTDQCPGVGQLFEIELIGAWVRRYESGLAEVAPRRAGAFGPKGRRQGRVTAKPQPAVPVPVCRPVPAAAAHAPADRSCGCGQCKHTVMPQPVRVRRMAPSPA